MHIRCPHCRNPLELVDDGALEDVNCPSCGSSFSLIPESNTETFRPESTASIGHFTVDERLGMGAFGSVWKARDTELDRIVAIKMPRKGQLTSEEAEKFLREARAAAQLRHPNIVSVHEVGRDGDTVYIVSDFVDGLTLTDWLTGHRPVCREAAELCIKLADALHHAHEQGVIHRDLKPGNIMLDRANEPHVMDFGLAKRDAGEITITMDGQVLGTPAYMSPEQAKGESHKVDRRADIYSLGVVLFEMITGERPFRGNKQMLLHQLLTEEAPSPRKFNASVPKDLETICLKCLEKDPEKRYATAQALQNDLKCFLENKPISARRISSLARGYRWCRRHPAKSASIVIALIAVLSSGALLSAWNYQGELESSRNSAITLAEEKTVLADENATLAEAEREQRLAAENAEADAIHAREQLQRFLFTERMRIANEALSGLEVNLLRARQALADCPEKYRDWDWRYLQDQVNRINRTQQLESYFPKKVARFTPDGLSVITSSKETLDSWSTQAAERVSSMPTSSHMFDVFIDDTQGTGKFVTATDNGHNQPATVEIWDAQSKTKIASCEGHFGRVNALRFSPDGKIIASGSYDETIRLWDSSTGQALHELKFPRTVLDAAFSFPSTVLDAAFSPDGSKIVGCSFVGTVHAFDRQTGKQLFEVDLGFKPLEALAISSDGKLLAVADRKGQIEILSLENGELLKTIQEHAVQILSLGFAPETDELIAGHEDGSIITYDIQKGRILSQWIDHSGRVDHIDLSPDGRWLSSIGGDRTLKVWDRNWNRVPANLAAESTRQYTAISVITADQKFIASHRREFEIWDLASRRKVRSVPSDVVTTLVAMAPDGHWFVGPGYNGSLFVRNLQGEILHTLEGHTKDVLAVCVSPSGEWIASLSEDKTVRIWKSLSGELVHSMTLEQTAFDLCFSQDNSRLFVLESNRGLVSEWETQSGEFVRSLEFEREALEKNRVSMFVGSNVNKVLEVSPDDKILVVGNRYGSLTIINRDSGERIVTPPAHKGQVQCLCFSPDGTRIVSGSYDNKLVVWDPATGRETIALQQPAAVIQGVAFSPDGQQLVSVDYFGMINVWEIED